MSYDMSKKLYLKKKSQFQKSSALFTVRQYRQSQIQVQGHFTMDTMIFMK